MGLQSSTSSRGPLRVLHLLGTAAPAGAGPARWVRELAVHLDAGRFLSEAWFLGEDGPLRSELEAAGVVARVLPFPGKDPAKLWHVARLLRRHSAQIVHIHLWSRGVRWAAAASGKKVVLQLHSRVTERGEPALRHIPTRGADAVVAVSSAVAEYARNAVVIYPVAVPDGTLPADDPKPVVGTACRLVPVKNLPVLLRAIASVTQQVPDVLLEIAGDGPERAALEKEAERLGVAGRVRFLGWVPDVRQVARGWRVFAQSSLDEGFPVAALEACAAGVPVVATRVGGLPELVQSGATGWLVPPGDADALAEKILLLLRDPAGQRRMAAAAIEDVRRRFSPERMSAAMAEVYERLVNQSSWPMQPPIVHPNAAPGRDVGPAGCTVIVCTRERPAHLRACLDALRRVQPGGFPVLVVDNAPATQATRTIANEFGVGYTVEPAPGLSRARNRGVHESTGEVVAFLDDDALPEAGWLTALLKEFADPAVGAVGGRVIPVAAEDRSRQAGRLRGSYLPGATRREVDRGARDWFAQANFGALGIGANMAFARAALGRCGGFDARLGRGTPLDVGEETYAFAQVVKLGYKVVFTPEAVVQHPFDPPQHDLIARRIASRASLTGYLAFLLAEEPRWSGQTVRYMAQRLFGRSPEWRGHLPREDDDVIPAWQAALALARGPFLYFRTAIFGPRRQG